MSPIQPSSAMQARACSICLETSTSQWYKDPNDKEKDLCRSCYDKSRKDIERFCFTCEKNVKTDHWYKDPNDKEKDLCRSCYDKSRKNIEVFCFTCEKNVQNSLRRKDPNNKEKDLCQKCYSRVIYQNKKRKGSLLFDEKPLLNIGSSLGDFHTYKSLKKDQESQAITYLESHLKQIIDNQENSSNKEQCEIFLVTDFLFTDNAPLDNHSLDSFDFNTELMNFP